MRLGTFLGHHGRHSACTSAVEFDCSGASDLNSEDDSVHIDLQFLAVGDVDLLALAYDFNRAVLHVE